MSNEADQYVPGFVANLSLKPQQTGTRLVHCVDADMNWTKPGTLFNADDIGEDDDEVDITERAPPSPESFADHQRRVGFFKSSGKGRFIEDLDTARMMQDPTNTIMSGMMATKNRATDRRIITTLFDVSRNGQNGENVVAFPAGQVLAASFRAVLHQNEAAAASGDLPLTIGKLLRAKTKMDRSELEGQRFFGCSAKQLEDLLAITPTTNSEYSNVKALVNGEINSLLGFTFARSEQFPLVAGVRRCAAWVKSAIQYRERPIKNAWIRPRDDRSGRMYAYYEVERGGLRRYDTAVVEVDCAEAAE